MAADSGDSQTLDLVHVALLLTYERTSTDPRFRGSKLHEVILPGHASTQVPLPVKVKENETFIAFDIDPPEDADSITEPDTPLNIIPAGGLAPNNPLRSSTPKQLETYFHRSRCHDMCFTCVLLLQYFFELFPPSTPLRIRHGPQPSKGTGIVAPSYITSIDTFRVVEQDLVKPRVQTTIVMMSQETGHRSGDEDTMVHAVARFHPPMEDLIGKEADVTESFLDLSSMQFGDVGRGPGKKGQGLFALDTASEFRQRMGSVCHGIVPGSVKVSHAVRPNTPMDSWLREVAARAKKRWDAAAKEKWCGHCGAPVKDDSKCAGCKAEWYCCREHQKMAWGFHKHYCSKSE